MATRYWVGGAGTWNSTNTTNWSTSSGGAGGASVPTAADDVIFDTNSDSGVAYTVNVSSGICLTLNTSSTGTTRLTLSGAVEVKGNTTCGAATTFTNLTITLTPASNMTLLVSGASNPVFGPNNTVNFNSNVTYTVSLSGLTSGTNTFVANAGTISSTTFGTAGTNNLAVAGGTVNASGTNYSQITINSGTLTQTAALTSQNITLNGGTFARSTFTTTVTSSFICGGTGARTLSGTSSFTLSGAGTIFSCNSATNLSRPNATTLSITNTSTAEKTLTGPTTGDTFSNTFGLDIASSAAGTFDIGGAFLTVTIVGNTAKTLVNNVRKVYADWNGNVVGLTYTAGPAPTTFAAPITNRTAAFNSTADFPLVFDGVGGAWTLTWANTTTSTQSDITVTNGSLTFTNAATTIRSLISNNSNTRTIVLPSSTTLTITGTTPINFTDGTNLTLTPGTGTIACSSSVVNFNGGGKTFATVNFTSTSLSSVNITGANTFTNIDFPTLAATYGVATLTLAANLTYTDNGSFNIGGTYNKRLFIRSDQIGVQRTITRVGAGSADFADCDFQDIAFSNITITTSAGAGNCGGNSGITFPTAKNVYWNSTSGGTWSDSRWALSSGGTPAVQNFPLPQDTVIIDNAGLNTGGTITIDAAYNLPSINGNRTNAWTLAGSVSNRIFGNLTLGSTTTFSYSGTLTFQRRGATQTITSNGAALSSIAGIVIENIGGSVGIGSALTMTGDPITVRRGTLSQSFDLTCGAVTVESTADGFAGFPNVTLSCTNWTFPASGSLTLGASHIIAYSGTFTGGGKSYRTLRPSGSSNLLADSNTMEAINRPLVLPATITFAAGTTQTITNTFLSGGTPSGSRISLRSSSPGTRYNLSKSSGTVNVVSLDIQDSNATGGAVWNAPTSSNNVDSGNNLGWDFTAIAAAFLMLFA